MEKVKNIPELRFPEFEGEWKKKKIGQLFNIAAGGDIGAASVKDVQDEEYKYPIYANAEKNKGLYGYSNLFKVEPPVVTIAGRGVNIGIAHARKERFYPIVRLLVLKPKLESSVEFYEYALNNLNVYVESTGVPQLTAPQISIYKLSIPTFPEQQKIASFLTAVDEKLTALKKKKELLEQYKKGVMQGIFCQNQKSLNHDSPDYLDGQDVKSGKSSPSQKSRFRQLRFKDDNGKDFPKWNYKHGNEIFESISDKNHNSDLPILAITQEHGAIPRDLIDYNISVTEASIESYKVVQKGDFIISLRSFQGGIEYSEYKGICSPAYIILRSKITIDDGFFKSYLKTESYIKELNKKLEGIRDGKMISYKYFSEVKLPFPCIEEQTKIANFLTTIDTKINQCQQQIEHTTQWKKGLLQKMFC